MKPSRPVKYAGLAILLFTLAASWSGCNTSPSKQSELEIKLERFPYYKRKFKSERFGSIGNMYSYTYIWFASSYVIEATENVVSMDSTSYDLSMGTWDYEYLDYNQPIDVRPIDVKFTNEYRFMPDELRWTLKDGDPTKHFYSQLLSKLADTGFAKGVLKMSEVDSFPLETKIYPIKIRIKT